MVFRRAGIALVAAVLLSIPVAATAATPDPTPPPSSPVTASPTPTESPTPTADPTPAPDPSSPATATPAPTAAPTPKAAPTSRPGAKRATEYSNPLRLEVDGGVAESCADPDIIRGQQAGDKAWYLYCTSDALYDDEFDAAGNLVIHNVPMFRSTDLVTWSYVGDAFPTKPSWVAPTGGVWAPEIAFRDGRYLLYFGASQTTPPLPGSPDPTGPSAIGVATSDSPTGPWTDTGVPVVAPDPSGRWQFDPEVLTADGTTYLYFGSYVGGIFARELASDGLTSIAASETRITIDNRYEGPVVLRHGGWYYLLASATDCCRGPLTGYAVFAGRSKSPLGPFVDRDGVSLLAGRVGGTPVLTQNGNRWVGTGHNTVFTDFAGQDWTIYHAVDQGDPYYASDVGYTKRPALLDPLDWRQGWPVVRGGAGPSDETMPAPAAQPRDKTAYRPRFVRDDRVGKTYARLSDSFDEPLLTNWTWIRPESASVELRDGQLRWQTQAADLQPPAAPLASVLTEPAPAGDYVVETKVTVTTPPEGCCQNYVQGGLVVYGDDGNYVKLTSASIWNTRQTEFGKHVSPVPEGYPSYGNTVVGPVGDSAYLRIVHRSGLYTAYTSIDGRDWVRGGTWSHDLASPRIGLVSMGGAGFESRFDYVRVSALRD